MHPYSEDERSNDDGETALNRMVEDRLYWQERDPEFRDYVDTSFKSVYGNGPAEADATGRTVTPAPRAVTLPPFRPSVTPEDTSLSGPVGDAEPNAWRDVLKVQKGLASTRHYAFDLAKERSGEHSPNLGRAIRDFQREKNEEIDGLLLPGGPTITRLRESLFGGNAANGARPAVDAVEGTGTILKRGLPTERPNRPAPEKGSGGAELIPVQYATPRPRQAPPPRDAGDDDAAKRFALPTERLPYDPKTWDQRAVIVKMPDGRSYILRNPVPREQRVKDQSDFHLSGGTAAHQMPVEVARKRFASAVPMTEEEAKAERERSAQGQGREPYPYRAQIPIRPGAMPVTIRYYRKDGIVRDVLARHDKTEEPLYAAGDEGVIISAHDALKLGLIDWMPLKPPPAGGKPLEPPAINPFPAPDWQRAGGRILGQAVRRLPVVSLIPFALDAGERVIRRMNDDIAASVFAPTPKDAEPTWR